MSREMKKYNLCSSKAIVASGSFTSEAIDLNNRAQNGNMALQYYIASSDNPTFSITYQLSIDGENFVAPSGGGTITTGLTKASGTSGRDIIDLTAIIEFAQWLKIIVTETGTSDGGSVTLDLLIQ